MEERIIKDINDLLAQLFQKMKEAGYEWDSDKKELKKIEQKPTEDDCKLSDCDKVDMTEYNNGYECGKQRVLKYPEDYGLCKKHTWSEENEKLIEQVADSLRKYSNYVQGGNSKVYILSLADSIESLQPQYTWKPSDEQIRELGIVATEMGWFNKDVLSGLLEQLKKLREE